MSYIWWRGVSSKHWLKEQNLSLNFCLLQIPVEELGFEADSRGTFKNMLNSNLVLKFII